jgi:hypothetical protein
MKNIVQHLRESLVNKQVNKESRETSFAMFPIRLETKFMERPRKDINSFDETFMFFKKINKLLNDLLLYSIIKNAQCSKDFIPAGEINHIRLPEPPNGNRDDNLVWKKRKEELLDKKTYVKELYELSNLAGKLDGIYNEDKSVILELCELLKVKWVFPEEFQKSITPFLDSMCQNANEIPVVKSLSSDRAANFLNKLEKVVTRLETLSKYSKTPYRGHHFFNTKKGNVKLINYIKKQISECNSFFTDMEYSINRIPSMTANQRTKLYHYFRNIENENINILNKYSSSIQANLRGLYYGFDKITWKDKDDFKTGSHFDAIVPIKDLDYIKKLIRPKALHSLRYTELIPFIIKVKMDALHSLQDAQGKFSVSESNIKKINELASESVFDYDNEKRLMKKMMDEINVLIDLHPTADRINAESMLVDFVEVFEGNKVVPEKLKKVNENSLLQSSNLNRFSSFILWNHASKRTEYVKCLCVRIFPDEIGINQFSKQLTKEEVVDAQAFWNNWYSASGNEEKQKEAWNFLCEKYEPYRAGWITKSMKPDVKYNGAVDSLTFPQIAESDLRDEQDLSKPVSLILPDRFAFIGQINAKGKKKRKIVRFGRRIFPDLQVGIHLTENQDIDPFIVDRDNGSITVNSGMRWMTDYNEAENVGMAITVPLNRLDHINFESIYVIGVKDADTKKTSSILTDLFTGHYYSEEGLNLLKMGTPTNIVDDSMNNIYDTSESKISESHYKQDVEMSFKSKVKDSLGDDVHRISAIFNLPIDDSNPWERVPDCTNMEIEKSLRVNELLAQLYIPNVNDFFSYLQRTHLANDISSRGVFPQMRIGSQPYGIVPITDFSRFKIKYGGWSISKLSELLLLITRKWNDIVAQSVLYEGNLATLNAEGNSVYLKNFIKMLSCTPTSSSFYSRKYIKNFLVDPAYFRGFRDNKGGGVRTFEKEVADIFKLGISESEGSIMQCLLPNLMNVPLNDYNEAEENKEPWKNLINISKLKELQSKFDIKDDELHQLIAEFFDLFTYRLDAWMTSLLNYTLRNRIKDKTHEVRIGAFGWVFDLEPKEESETKNEFILAPSINHAITGAVLRSSFNHAKKKGSDGEETTDYHLSVNLSSVRVREALRIIDGVNNGLSIGAILGSDLERYLHDSHLSTDCELDKYIYPLRKKYPLVSDMKDSSNGKAKNTISVINGDNLLYDLRKNIFKNNTDQLVDLVTRQNTEFREWFNNVYGLGFQSSHEEVICFVKQIQHMEDSYDALSDVILSESVYKLTEGNREVVDALMCCVEQGKNIPRPDVVNIPLHGVHVEQRMVVALNTQACVQNFDAILSLADPAIDEWIGDMLGGFSGLMVDRTEVNISPTELLYLSEDEKLFFKSLELKVDGFTPNSKISLKISNGELPFSEARLLLSCLREQLAGSRMLKPSDLTSECVPDDASSYDIDEMRERYNHIYYFIHRLVIDLSHLKNKFESYSDPMTIPKNLLIDSMNLLEKVYRAGLIHCLDRVEKDVVLDESRTDEEGINSRKEAISNLQNAINFAISEYITHIRQASDKINEDKNEITKYIEAIQILLIKSLKIAPKIKTNNTKIDVAELSQQLDSTWHFNNFNDVALESWLIDVAKVRKTYVSFITGTYVQRMERFRHLPIFKGDADSKCA